MESCIVCKYCGSPKVKRNGKCRNVQRYLCFSCKRTFATERKPPKYSDEKKAEAIKYYMNNCGIRKTALFVDCSPGTIINWIREATCATPDNQAFALNSDTGSSDGDFVEMDEIYTFCLKKPTE